MSDPFLRIAILDQNGHAVDEKQTAHIKNTRNPVWKDTLVLHQPPGTPVPITVSISLFDKDLRKEQLISMVRMQLEHTAGQVSDFPMPVKDSPMQSISFHHRSSPDLFFEPRK